MCRNSSKYAKKCNDFVSFEFIHFEMKCDIETGKKFKCLGLII